MVKIIVNCNPNVNTNGPRIDPCGTPLLMAEGPDCAESSLIAISNGVIS